jgi:hypothetical protein
MELSDYTPMRIEPVLTLRECGGWLAAAPKWSPLRIGVIGNSEAETRDNFHRSLGEWMRTLAAN